MNWTKILDKNGNNGEYVIFVTQQLGYSDAYSFVHYLKKVNKVDITIKKVKNKYGDEFLCFCIYDQKVYNNLALTSLARATSFSEFNTNLKQKLDEIYWVDIKGYALNLNTTHLLSIENLSENRMAFLETLLPSLESNLICIQRKDKPVLDIYYKYEDKRKLARKKHEFAKDRLNAIRSINGYLKVDDVTYLTPAGERIQNFNEKVSITNYAKDCIQQERQ